MSFSKNHTQFREKNEVLGKTLYLVATPIGNLADISERALKVLSEVDFVAAEDTRNTGLLLSRFGISKSMVSYFEHNKRERGEIIVSRIEAGESCALVTHNRENPRRRKLRPRYGCRNACHFRPRRRYRQAVC